MSTIQDWADQACSELGLDPGTVDIQLVLDLARDVAHGAGRPAAPLTAYLLGVAVERGQTAADASARLTRLAAAWGEAGSQVT